MADNEGDAGNTRSAGNTRNARSTRNAGSGNAGTAGNTSSGVVSSVPSIDIGDYEIEAVEETVEFSILVPAPDNREYELRSIYRRYNTGMHSIDVGLQGDLSPEADANDACVRMRSYRNSVELSLDAMSYRTWCSRNIELERGAGGTVPMLKAALVLAMSKFGWCERVVLMDTSRIECGSGAAPDHDLPLKVTLSDYYIMTRKERSSWYQRHLGAVVAPEFRRRLSSNLAALQETVKVGDGAQFVKFCMYKGSEKDPALRDYVRKTTPKVLATFAAAAAQGQSWGTLFEALANDCVIFHVCIPTTFAAVMSEWHGTYGWRWTIERDVVESWEAHAQLRNDFPVEEGEASIPGPTRCASTSARRGGATVKSSSA